MMRFCACGCESRPVGLSRRNLFAGMAALGVAAARPALARLPATPADAMAELRDGNERFAQHRLISLSEDLTILRQDTVAEQKPFAAVLSCADSRVPVELIFDQSIGKLFVTRVAGNVATAEIVASLEYGVAVLGVSALIVLGHANCGALAAAMANKPVPGQISALYKPLQPAIKEAGGNLEKAIERNAEIQADLLASASPVLAGAIKDKKLEIKAAYYDLATGQVGFL